MLAAVMAVAVGCKKDAPEPAAGDEPTTEPAVETAEAPAEAPKEARKGEPPRIELLSAGAEPRVKLRYKLPADAQERMFLTMNTSVTAMGTPMALPTMTLLMDIQLLEKIGEDAARYSFELTGSKVEAKEGVQEQVVTMTRQALEQAHGMKGTVVVDSRGFNREMTMEMPPGLSAETRSMMESSMQGMDQLASPLPEEPVGVGARWKVSQTVEQNAMKIDQALTYELVELHGDEGTLAVVMEQSAEPQKVALPGMPTGAAAELVSLESKGKGTVKLNLDELAPESKMQLTSAYTMKVSAQGQEQLVNTEMQMSIEMGNP